MSGKSTEQQDNSIEDILASIRQIISEDEPKGDVAPTPVAVDVPPEPVFESAPATPDVDEPETTEDDVFELVDRVIAQESEPEAVAPEPEPEPEPAFVPPTPVAPPPSVVTATPEQVAPAPSSVAVVDETPIFTEQAATATLGAFSKLSETVLLERQRAIAGANVTLEDIVKELLQPLLRQWIDQHVPGIVDRLVREELEKLSRQAREG